MLLEMPMEPFDYPDNDPGSADAPDGPVAARQSRQALLADGPVRRLFRRDELHGRALHRFGGRFLAGDGGIGHARPRLVDDGTSNRSLAAQLAARNKVPFARGDAEIDANPDRGAILEKLADLEARAADKGFAVGIASALPVTIDALTEWAAGLESRGAMLVPVSAVMK